LVDIAAQIKKKGYTRTMNDLADKENVPRKTLENWWAARNRVVKARAKAEAGSSEKSGAGIRVLVEESEKSVAQHSLSEELPAAQPDPPKAPYLDTDGGTLSCSRCGSTNHVEFKMEAYFCSICGVLQFDGFAEDIELKTYYVRGGHPQDWMR